MSSPRTHSSKSIYLLLVLLVLFNITLTTASPLVLVRQHQAVCTCLTTGLYCDSITCTEAGCVETCCKDCADHPFDPVCQSANVKTLCTPGDEELGSDPMDGNVVSPSSSPVVQPQPSETGMTPTASPEVSMGITPTPRAEPTKEGGESGTHDSNRRPFPPAACECVAAGVECDKRIAVESGVCASGIEAEMQGAECLFSCCRLCTVNSAVEYCNEEVVRGICEKWIR